MRRKMPMPVTVGDCLLLHQMGYRVEINDGRVTAVVKENKKKNGISRNKTNSIVSLAQWSVKKRSGQNGNLLGLHI